MISVGTDIVECATIEKLIKEHGDKFINRVFSPLEVEYCESKVNRLQCYSARYASKEATMKALGIGWNEGIQWNQIAIEKLDSGKPILVLTGEALKQFEKAGFTNSSVSLSHTPLLAISNVILF